MMRLRPFRSIVVGVMNSAVSRSGAAASALCVAVRCSSSSNFVPVSDAELKAMGVAPGPPPSALDEAAEAVNKSGKKKGKGKRREKSMDDILGELVNDAMRRRDRGEKVDEDDVKKEANDKLFRKKYGVPPPSSKDAKQVHVPLPPDFTKRRLQPFDVCDDDPWPERAITPESVPMTNREREEDMIHGTGRAEQEAALFAPREGRDPVMEFADAIDELHHWEHKFICFLRDVPLWQRRALPLLHEYYRVITHRLVRAEKRFVKCRDGASPIINNTRVYERTELRILRVHQLYYETHRSLQSANIDPKKMKRFVSRPLLTMSDDEFADWCAVERQTKNALIADVV